VGPTCKWGEGEIPILPQRVNRNIPACRRLPCLGLPPSPRSAPSMGNSLACFCCAGDGAVGRCRHVAPAALPSDMWRRRRAPAEEAGPCGVWYPRVCWPTARGLVPASGGGVASALGVRRRRAEQVVRVRRCPPAAGRRPMASWRSSTTRAWRSTRSSDSR
jgi:hypothetical protein